MRKRVNALDNLMTSKAVDALINYETVKLFTNEGLEVGASIAAHLFWVVVFPLSFCPPFYSASGWEWHANRCGHPWLDARFWLLCSALVSLMARRHCGHNLSWQVHGWCDLKHAASQLPV